MRRGRLVARALVASVLAVAAHAASGDDVPGFDGLLALAPPQQIAWGQRYEHGEGVPRDVAAAVRLYCAAAGAGSAEAAYRLGWLYMNGRGARRDDALAAAWLRVASRAGDGHARRILHYVDAGDEPRSPECIAPVANVPIAPGVVPGPAPARKAVTDARAVAPPSAVIAGTEEDAPDGGGIERTVRSWAAAWSARDADRYLAHYSPDFRSADGGARAEWASLRRLRVTAPAFIEVELEKLRVTPLEPGRAQVRFEQRYRSDVFADRVVKELVMVREDDGWRIVREHALENVAGR